MIWFTFFLKSIVLKAYFPHILQHNMILNALFLKQRSPPETQKQ